MSFPIQRPNPCRNFNHGRSNVQIAFCPECGQRFRGASGGVCNAQKHGEFRKQRFSFCIDCGTKLNK